MRWRLILAVAVSTFLGAGTAVPSYASPVPASSTFETSATVPSTGVYGKSDQSKKGGINTRLLQLGQPMPQQQNPRNGAITPQSTEHAGGGGGGATCSNCLGHAYIFYTDYSLYEWVGVDRVENTADEVIDEQNNHGTLIRNEDGSCSYGGEQVWSEFSPTVANTYSVRIDSDSNSYYGDNDGWVLATGHDWWDDGAHFYVSEGNDVCRAF